MKAIDSEERLGTPGIVMTQASLEKAQAELEAAKGVVANLPEAPIPVDRIHTPEENRVRIKNHQKKRRAEKAANKSRRKNRK